LTAERNAGELEGDLWEDIELEMYSTKDMNSDVKFNQVWMHTGTWMWVHRIVLLYLVETN
jgi:hypothetical protein